jgi:hypothetical protein
MSDWIIAFASLSAACELFGTLTVLRSFWSTAEVAKQIKRALDPSQNLSDVFSEDTYRQVSKLNSLLKSIADQIGWDSWTLAGLVAYILGAGFGLAAAILAVSS